MAGFFVKASIIRHISMERRPQRLSIQEQLAAHRGESLMQNLKKTILFGNLVLLIVISISFIQRMYRASMEPQTFVYNMLCFLFVILSAGVTGFAIGAGRK